MYMGFSYLVLSFRACGFTDRCLYRPGDLSDRTEAYIFSSGPFLIKDKGLPLPDNPFS